MVDLDPIEDAEAVPARGYLARAAPVRRHHANASALEG
jgi:hypothetical protein